MFCYVYVVVSICGFFLLMLLFFSTGFLGSSFCCVALARFGLAFLRNYGIDEWAKRHGKMVEDIEDLWWDPIRKMTRKFWGSKEMVSHVMT